MSYSSQITRCELLLLILSSYLSCSLADRWGTTVYFTTSFLHSSRFSAFRSNIFYSKPVHSLTLYSHRFLILSLHLHPWTVPCRIVLASPVCVFSLKPGGLHMVRWRFQFWLSLPHWSQHGIPRSLQKHLFSGACTHRRFPAVPLRIYFAHGGQRELPSLPCSTPALGVVAGATTVQNGGCLLLLCLGVGQRIHEPWYTMCTHTHSLLPVCQEGHYRTPGERGSGLLEIVEIRGMLEVRGREERGEKKWNGSPL